MELKEYRNKRNFEKTREPRGGGKTEKDAWRFVIQKHAARKLHFDLRLEVDGVFKSWAIPKEPNQESRKILAIEVEDHPLDYGNFEGEILPGNYGAGFVEIWDKGVYERQKFIGTEENWYQQGLEKGKLSFFLKGEKLYGNFSLVKIKKGDNKWFFFKSKDEYFGKVPIRTKEPLIQDLPLADWPGYLPPMLCMPSGKVFEDKNWLFELKVDGYRMMSYHHHGNIELISRNEKKYNDKFRALLEGLKKIPHELILDGEVTALDSMDHPSFRLLQEYITSGKGRLVYYVFDILYLDGHDLRDLPLIERKMILKNILPKSMNIRYMEEVMANGKEFFELVKKSNLEGIIAKEINSVYESGRRSSSWLKIKAVKIQEAIVVGFTEPRGSRKHFGSLVLGIYEKNELTYIGNVGSGFSQADLKKIKSNLEEIELSKTPFPNTPKFKDEVHWTRPVLVCEVKFTEWTGENQLRHPVFLRWREDKAPQDVRKEEMIESDSESKKAAIADWKMPWEPLQKEQRVIIDGQDLRLTNLDKIFWPEEGYTKGDMLAYYDRVADMMMPYLKGRLINLNRYPNGISGKSFYHKEHEDNIPSWIHAEKIYSKSKERHKRYLVCQNKATLLYLAQLASIEINPWHSKIDNIENPDYAILDLDPDENKMRDVARTSRYAYEIFNFMEIPSFCKTSGGDGLHIYVPLAGRYHYSDAVNFMKLVAILVNRKLPDMTSIERSPAKRRGKIYLDFLQNNKGQTIVAPYSLRPRPGATVSTPLDWDEVRSDLDPRKFNIKTVFERFLDIGDIWGGVLGPAIDMEKAISKIKF